MLTATHQTRRDVRIAVATVATAVGITCAACGTGDSDPTSTSVAPTASVVAPHDVSGQPSNTSQTAVAFEVIRTAESATGGTVYDIESDSNGTSGTVWDVKVAGNGESQDNLTLSADGTTVTSRTRATKPDDDVNKLRSATVTLQQAISNADPRAKGKGTLSSAEIDTSKGAVVWQVSFGGDSGTTVLVDARTGSVLTVGRDAG